MVRYIRQPTTYTCGPTAIINAAKWAGRNLTIKEHHKFYTNISDSNFDDGASESGFEKGLRFAIGELCSIKKKKTVTMNELHSFLKNDNNAIVLLYWIKLPGFSYKKLENVMGHYTFVFRDVDGRYIAVNDSRIYTQTVLSRETLKHRISFLKSLDDSPSVWFIRKKNGK